MNKKLNPIFYFLNFPIQVFHSDVNKKFTSNRKKYCCWNTGNNHVKYIFFLHVKTKKHPDERENGKKSQCDRKFIKPFHDK